MNRNFQLRSQRTGWWLIAALAALTLTGHFLIQGLGAIPAYPPNVPLPPAAGTPTAGAPTAGTAGVHGIDFASPGGGRVSFTGKLDRQAVLRGGDGVVKMELILKAEEGGPSAAVRTPTDFVIVLDRSGSMGGLKIEQARTAVRELISQLAADDRFALVTYSSTAEVAIPLAAAGQTARHHWRQVVAGVRSGGGTNMSAGLDLGLYVSQDRALGRATRLMLISDGLANEGDASIEGLASRARRAAAREGVVSTVGVGEDFNEFLMSTLADAGTGNYYYLRDTEQLARVFSDEFEATRETVATAVAVKVDAGEGVRVLEAAGYPLEHRDGETVFRPGSLFAGQERRIWVTLKIPNGAVGDHRLGTFALTYKDPTAGESGVTRVVEFTESPVVACVASETEYHDSFDQDTWARSVAEEDYNDLQQKVAGYVKAGRRAEALQEIGDFKEHNERLNFVMRKEEIYRKLEELQSLQAEVEDAFEGADQAAKQNHLSKARQYAGREGRRAGSKKAQSAGQGGS